MAPTKPNFLELLRNPLLSDIPLPTDFSVTDEANHLSELWEKCHGLQKSEYVRFIHSGGSGMVFHIKNEEGIDQALKIVRKRLYSSVPTGGPVATSLSPVSHEELSALRKISHPNVVRLYEAIEDQKGVIAISTTFVENPLPLDEYLRRTLGKHPDKHGRRRIHPFSPRRLDDACAFLIARAREIASAMVHMHSQMMFHFDIKPANILISGARKDAMLTDLGSSIDLGKMAENQDLRVHFTWTYAHPTLTNLVTGQVTGISGGGLKTSAIVNDRSNLASFDLFAFGRTLQECLEALHSEFGERCFSSYGFRYLHLVACLLLDGHNTPLPEGKKIRTQDNRVFINDTALNYPIPFYTRHKLASAKHLHEALSRFSREYSWNAQTPELDPWQPDIVNTGAAGTSPFTERVSKVLSHPAMRRLKNELQLGWIKEVFPGANHNRWSHTIGVFSNVVAYVNALLADPDVPTLRVIVDHAALSHAFLAALLHDAGQTEFGHDLEAACPGLFRHEALVARLLNERYWGEPLSTTIEQYWPDIDLERVANILSKNIAALNSDVDSVTTDILDGPIDTDKFDYVLRDSVGCGVSYGVGVDRKRLLHALSVGAATHSKRLSLAYKSKGSSAIDSLLLARYQMYGAVYWHHTFRCIQAMFTQAAAATFGELREKGYRTIRGWKVTGKNISDLLYHIVVCGKPASVWRKEVNFVVKDKFFEEQPPAVLTGERSLSFLWYFADDSHRLLLERLAKRELYKRVFELRIGELGEMVDYSALESELEPSKRLILCSTLEKAFLDSVYKRMSEKGPTTTETEDEARKRYQELRQSKLPLVLIDFPTRGIPQEVNFPIEIPDSARKYISGAALINKKSKTIFHQVRIMQIQLATVRVFCAPELHELVIRYLTPEDVQTCVENAVPKLRIHS